MPIVRVQEEVFKFKRGDTVRITFQVKDWNMDLVATIGKNPEDFKNARCVVDKGSPRGSRVILDQKRTIPQNEFEFEFFVTIPDDAEIGPWHAELFFVGSGEPIPDSDHIFHVVAS